MSENIIPENGQELEQEPIYLTDEEGNEYPFDLLDIVSYEGNDYAVFFPSDSQDGEESDEDTEEEVVILRVIPHEDGSAEFESTDDTATLDAVFDLFLEDMRKAFDEDDEDGHGDGCGCGHCHE